MYGPGFTPQTPRPAADDAPDDAKIDNIFLPPKNLLLSNIVF